IQGSSMTDRLSAEVRSLTYRSWAHSSFVRLLKGHERSMDDPYLLCRFGATCGPWDAVSRVIILTHRNSSVPHPAYEFHGRTDRGNPATPTGAPHPITHAAVAVS